MEKDGAAGAAASARMRRLRPPSVNIALAVEKNKEDNRSPMTNAPSITGSDQTSATMIDTWACAACTFANKPLFLNCEVCGIPRNTPSSKEKEQPVSMGPTQQLMLAAAAADEAKVGKLLATELKGIDEDILEYLTSMVAENPSMNSEEMTGNRAVP